MPCWFLSVTKIGHLKVAALLQKRSVGMIFAHWQICQGTSKKTCHWALGFYGSGCRHIFDQLICLGHSSHVTYFRQNILDEVSMNQFADISLINWFVCHCCLGHSSLVTYFRQNILDDISLNSRWRCLFPIFWNSTLQTLYILD